MRRLGLVDVLARHRERDRGRERELLVGERALPEPELLGEAHHLAHDAVQDRLDLLVGGRRDADELGRLIGGVREARAEDAVGQKGVRVRVYGLVPLLDALGPEA